MQDKAWQVADTIEYGLLKANAKANRKEPTEAESFFWNLAKSNGLGEKCRRQYIIGEYIVDFLFRKSLLIVEIDGGYHMTEKQQELDTVRQKWLEDKGYTVLRFTNEQVLYDTDTTINKIKEKLHNE